MLNKIFTVLTGAASRQCLVFISTIAIAKYFDVASIAELTLFISITSVAQHFVFLKLDYSYLSVTGQKNKYEQLSLAGISLVIHSVLLSFILGYLIELNGYEWLFPFLCFFLFIGGLTEKILLREGDYREVRKLKFSDGSSQLILPFVLVKALPSDLSLIASRALCFIAYLIVKVNKKAILLQFNVTKRLLFDLSKLLDLFIGTLKKNSFIIYSGLLSSISLNIPIFFIASKYDSEVLGNYGIVMRFLSVPVTLVGLSLSSVLLSEVSRAVRNGQIKKIKNDFIRFSTYTFFLSLTVFLVCIFYPNIISFVLDDKWELSTQIVTALALHLSGQMFVSPLSTLSISLNKTKQQAFLDSVRLLILLVVFSFDEGDVIDTLTLYSIVSFLIYLVYFIFYYNLVRRKAYEVVS